MQEFEVDGVQYKCRNMGAFDQMDILTKLSPLLASGIVELLPLLAIVKELGLASIADLPKEEIIARAPGIARELAKMSSADRHFIVESCLSLCERKVSADRWAPVWAVGAGRAMFDDINNDFWVMVRVAFGVLSHTPSFMRFFPAGL